MATATPTLTKLDRKSGLGPQQARAVTEAYIARDPADKRARLHIANLALRLGNKEVAATHIPLLPTVGDVDAEEGAAVVDILLEVGRSDEAAEYAYDLLRRHFQDHRAHRAFRDARLRLDSTDVVPDKAGPGVAVCLSENGAIGLRWYVVEDSTVTAPSVEFEISGTSEFALLLAGKRIGESVVLSEGPLKRTSTIVDLLTKQAFRLQDVLDRWQYRFPERQEMWVMRTTPTDADGKPDLSSMLEVLNDRKQRLTEAESVYRTKLISVKLFADAIGKSEIEGIQYIASSDDLALRCCVGSAEEYSDAAAALKAAGEVAIDTTALATLLMLDELAVLDVIGKMVTVTHSTMAGLRTFVRQAKEQLRSAGSMGVNGDEPIMFVTPAEAQRAAFQALERAQDVLEAKCQIVGCTALADVDPSDRKSLEAGLGSSALETAIVGAGASRMMWTDDWIVAQIGQHKFGTKRIWTHAVLRELNAQGLLPDDRYARASARLLGWQYMFTAANSRDLRASGNLSEWRPDRWPLRQTLKHLSQDTLRAEHAVVLSARLVADCYADAHLPETRRFMLQAVAEALAKRADASRSIAMFGAVAGRAFGLNASGKLDAERTFAAWRGEYLRRISPVRL